jgi:hypothetical protein
MTKIKVVVYINNVRHVGQFDRLPFLKYGILYSDGKERKKLEQDLVFEGVQIIRYLGTFIN